MRDRLARSVDPPCPLDPAACANAIVEDDAEALAWVLEHGAPHPTAAQLEDALDDIHHPDPAIFLIMSSHRVSSAAQYEEQASSIRESWCTVLGLVRWARRTQPSGCLPGNQVSRTAGDASEPVMGLQRGRRLLMQLAHLLDELVYHIGAAGGMCFQPGGRVFRRMDWDSIPRVRISKCLL